MLTVPDSILAEAGETIYRVSADEHMRQLLEAREDAIRQELDVQRNIEQTTKKLTETVAKLDETSDKLKTTAAERDQVAAERDEAFSQIEEKDHLIAELKAQLAKES